MKDYSKYKLNIKKSPHDSRDFKFRAIYAPVALPTKFSHRQFMLPARDQEDTPSVQLLQDHQHNKVEIQENTVLMSICHHSSSTNTVKTRKRKECTTET